MLQEYSIILNDAAENLDPLHNCQKKVLHLWTFNLLFSTQVVLNAEERK